MTVSEFYKSIFGQKVYKISLDAGCTCPNRDGKTGTGGCIFCSGSGSGEFASSRNLPVKEQVEQAKNLLAPKLKKQDVKYLAYFQNFTNTYGNLEQLQKKWEEALCCKNVTGLALGTRPDCLSNQCIQIISDIAAKSFVQIELGLQTTNQKTADYINRCYKNEEYFLAVKKLHQTNPKIHIVTHVIFGLPGDSPSDMLKTVQDVVDSGADGIKITCLFVTKNTVLADEYLKRKIKVLEKDEYYDLLKKALDIIPKNLVIHRLTGDPAKKDLIAPLWTTDKKRVLNEIKTFISAANSSG